MVMSIGALSEQCGVKIPTIRYYEQDGLMPEPIRTDGNRRVYDDRAVKRLRFIRHARELGFEIDAIRELLALAGQPSASCQSADAIALRHLADIDKKLERLTSLRKEVARIVESCDGGSVSDCRVIEVLADHGQCLHDRH